MAVRFKLGYYSPLTDDPLNRDYVGYFPRMTEEEAWTAGRGVWKANKERLSREKFALIIGDSRVCAVAEIRGVSVYEDRVAVDGEALGEGHPVRDAWIGKPDPVVNASQNPVGYCDLPEEAEFRERPCGCGCGEISTRDFLPGHDVRAFQDRVRRMFAGSALEFFRWVDRIGAEHGLPLLANPTGGTALPDEHREPPNPDPGEQSPHDPGISYAALSDSGDLLSGNESRAESGEPV
ncbi:hypothetical protein [Nocardia farcinica]|uniref:Uncharacterized protein n=1 Tax=Nocardia farcinica (strain IFM 10152) TaxID=247156 RepID=Q5YMP4_NOCFA|nr:hypothetical protein [Nocardia farcinica]BAD60547.1 hypothetical protein PNF1_220 [Nocardia farcinica IFM 10152]